MLFTSKGFSIVPFTKVPSTRSCAWRMDLTRISPGVTVVDRALGEELSSARNVVVEFRLAIEIPCGLVQLGTVEGFDVVVGVVGHVGPSGLRTVRTGLVDARRHLGSLCRSLDGCGRRVGPVPWSGTEPLPYTRQESRVADASVVSVTVVIAYNTHARPS